MNAGKVIFDLLSNDATVSAEVGTAIYPVRAPQGHAATYIVYQVVANGPTAVKDHASTLDTTRVQVSTVAADYATAVSIDDAARKALDRQTGSIASETVDLIDYQGSVDGFDEEVDLFMIMSDFNVRITRTT